MSVSRALGMMGAAASALLCAPMAAGAGQSMGQLVYSFTYSSDQNVTARDSATAAEDYSGGMASSGGSGASHYHGVLNDKGTMTVDVIRQQTDGGLIVTISEQGENARRSPPAECVVYGNTNVICDPNKSLYSEEYTLLRFLGSNFVNPSQLDANRHWAIVQAGAVENVTADYAISSNNNGMMQIGEKRTIKESAAGHLTTDVQTKIGYDFSRAVPTSVDEYATQYSDNGMKGTSRVIYQTTLNLVSDSVPKQ